MSAWTEDEIATLTASVEAGQTSAQISEAIGRSVPAVNLKLSELREQGVDISHPRREAPQGGPGRPPNSRPTVKLWMRLHKSTKDALELAFGELTPQQRIELALAHYLGDVPELPECDHALQELSRNARFAVQWCVDADLLARAVACSKLTRPKTGELAVEHLLAHYGYTFEES